VMAFLMSGVRRSRLVSCQTPSASFHTSLTKTTKDGRSNTPCKPLVQFVAPAESQELLLFFGREPSGTWRGSQ
jgi:hypothetical protein